MTSTAIYIVMGVSGSGKSTIGTMLAKKLQIPFFDGDDFHPQSNLQKMKSGQALTDEDRKDWLIALNQLAQKELSKKGAVIACSALKASYRKLLKEGIGNEVTFIYLEGDLQLIQKRMAARTAHFMPVALLQSQFDTLEPPQKAFTISIDQEPEDMVETILDKLYPKSSFGVIGLGVMGKSLCRNLARNGYRISMFNRHVEDSEESVARHFKNKFEELTDSKAFDHLGNFVVSLERPRKILIMIKAGKPLDDTIASLLPYLDAGDILIDGGNSHFQDTEARQALLENHQIHFIGAGISGGEEGALNGPSIMPGGNEQAYRQVAPFLEKIAAKDELGGNCCQYIGPAGSGHFVKTIHNGIEYAEMQLLAEVYYLLRTSDKNPDDIAMLFQQWQQEGLDSFLLDSTIDILQTKENGEWLIYNILDKAGNKGTGNWSTVAASQLGIPATMIAASLFARYVSAAKEKRMLFAKEIEHKNSIEKVDLLELKEAYATARIVNHCQGFELLTTASKAYNWSLNLTEIARIWTNGCIIRSELMERFVSMLKESDEVLLHSEIIDAIKTGKPGLKSIVALSIEHDIASPCLHEALNYLHAMATPNSSANLIQAQRDYFGAHTYERVDRPGTFHTHWKKTTT